MLCRAHRDASVAIFAVVSARARARAHKEASKCALEKVTLDDMRRSGFVAVEEATSGTVSLTALFLAAMLRAPRLPERGGGRGSCASASTRKREHTEKEETGLTRAPAERCVRYRAAGRRRTRRRQKTRADPPSKRSE